MNTVRSPKELDALRPLYQAKYLQLITYRKTGKPVATPVWFAEHQGILYIATSAESGKFKRAQNNSRVQVAPCTAQGKATGRTFEARGRVITSEQEQQIAEVALRKRYGIVRWFYYLFLEISRRLNRHPRPEQGYLVIEDIAL